MRVSKRATVIGMVVVAVVVVVAGTWAVLGGGSRPVAQTGLRETPTTELVTTATGASTTTTTEPTSSGVTTATTATTTGRTTTTTATRPRAATVPAPTAHPVNIPVPPPPHPAPVPGCAPSHSGTPAGRPEVKSALLSAANTQYWAHAANPPLLAIDDPAATTPPATPKLGAKAVITVPAGLIQAIAWQESGWQSDIKACDGGVGTMQVMSGTASWMNQRFGTSYDYTTLSGNAAVGAEYLQWLIAYFGENYFGYHYDMTDQDLLTAVIVAYNVGPNNVVFTAGHTTTNAYARSVLALMSQQPWN